MKRPLVCSQLVLLFILLIVQSETVFSATKPHVITFGKWTSVQWVPDSADEKPSLMKIRPLLVDARMKEFTTGLPHDVTDRLFVIRQVFRLNDSLPEESTSALRWQWQSGGWLLVDRMTGRISAISLPEFDAVYSTVSWYRDYAAYCGTSDDGKKVYAVVAQINRRKAVVKKAIEQAKIGDAAPAALCSAPRWERSPARVTFEILNSSKITFAIRGRTGDLVVEDLEDEEAEE
jgi:hypothetical protein